MVFFYGTRQDDAAELHDPPPEAAGRVHLRPSAATPRLPPRTPRPPRPPAAAAAPALSGVELLRLGRFRTQVGPSAHGTTFHVPAQSAAPAPPGLYLSLFYFLILAFVT